MIRKLARRAAVHQSAPVDQDKTGIEGSGKRCEFVQAGDHLEQMANGRSVADKAQVLRRPALEQVGCCSKARKGKNSRRSEKRLAGIGIDPADRLAASGHQAGEVETERRLA